MPRVTVAPSASSSFGPFAAREPLFAHGDISLRLLLPRSADELIDEGAFARDERLPYWADPGQSKLSERYTDTSALSSEQARMVRASRAG